MLSSTGMKAPGRLNSAHLDIGPAEPIGTAKLIYLEECYIKYFTLKVDN